MGLKVGPRGETRGEHAKASDVDRRKERKEGGWEGTWGLLGSRKSCDHM